MMAGVAILSLLFITPLRSEADVPHVSDIAKDFESVFGVAPTQTELEYWAFRRYDKLAVTGALLGAMEFTRDQESTMGRIPSLYADDIMDSIEDAFVRVYGRVPTEEEWLWWAERVACYDLGSYKEVYHSMLHHKAHDVAMGVGTIDTFCERAETLDRIYVPAGLGKDDGVNHGIPYITIVAQDFESIFGRAPTREELEYWSYRRFDKVTRDALRGAMEYTRNHDVYTGYIPYIEETDVDNVIESMFNSVYGRKPDDIEHLWWLARIECANLESYEDMHQSMKYHASQKVGTGAGSIEDFCGPLGLEDDAGWRVYRGVI